MDRVVVTRLLSSKKEEEASAAQHLLADAAARASQAERDEAVAVLLAALEKDERRIRRNKCAVLFALLGVSVVCLVSGLLLIASGYNRRFPVFLVFLPVQIGSMASLFFSFRKHCSPVRVRAGLALARHGDPRALGPLIEAFAAAREETDRAAINEAISGLLPGVRPGDDRLLNGRQQELLQIVLRNWSPNWFTAAKDEEADGLVHLVNLAALIGDKSTVPALAAVADRTPNRESDKRVIEAAQTSLAALNARLNEHIPTVAGLPRFRARP